VKQTLIFEAYEDGHRQEFIEHLLTYINDNPSLSTQYIFLLNKDLVERLNVSTTHIQIETLETNLSIKQHEQYIIQTLDRCKNIDTLLFMNIDLYKNTIISLVFKKYSIKIKGILFQPFHQFPKQGFNIKSMRFRKKNHLLATLMLNRKIEQIFVLNDEKGVNYLNKWAFKYTFKHIFNYLVDPIDCRNKLETIDKTQLLAQYNIEKGRYIILAFGGIDERKNVLNSIKALSLLDKTIQKQICFWIVGRNNLSEKKALPDLIEATFKSCPDLQIVQKAQFVTDEEREQMFMLSDVVLMPYINFFASSGVLGHAIKYGKRVISSNQGVTSDIIEKYELGELVNPTDIQSITEGVSKIINQLSDSRTNQHIIAFQKAHTPTIFAQTLLK
jgi:glycosyltransferase involved in cell wall biosynthesis